MKRIVVALALECEPLYRVLRAARSNSAAIGLDDETVGWLNSILDGVKRIQLRKMMGEE